MANYISQIQTPDGVLYTLYDRNAARKEEAIYYVEGSSGDTAGTWTGTLPGLSEYFQGLTIIYVPKVAGSANGCTLNINTIATKPCYVSEGTVMTTEFAAGTPILLTYMGNRWSRADSDQHVRVTRRTSGYNAEYPILVSSQTTIGTAGQDGSYSDVEAVVYNTNAPTINPSTGAITAAGGFIGNATSADKVNHALYIGPYEYDGSADVTVGIYDGENE